MKNLSILPEMANSEKIYVIGCGPGSPDYILPIALKTARQCSTLVGASRLIDLIEGFEGEFHSIEGHGVSGVFDAIENTSGVKGILVSGSPYVFSLASRIVARFGAEKCVIIPGMSSAYIAAAKTGIDGTNMTLISSHAALPTYKFSEVSMKRKVALLCGNPRHHQWVFALALSMQPTHQIILCRDLTLENEYVAEVEASDLPELMQGGRELLLFISHDTPYFWESSTQISSVL